MIYRLSPATAPGAGGPPGPVFSKLSFSPSSVASIDRVARLNQAVRARIKGLTFQYINVLGSPVRFTRDFDSAVSALSAISLRLVDNSVVCNDVYRSCYLAFKDFPSNLENHCVLLFGSFTKKKKFDYEYRLKQFTADLGRARLDGCRSEFLKHLESRVSDERFFLEQMSSFVDKMKAGMMAGRKSELLRRLSVEIEDRFAQGWHFVFNTLTVAPEHFSQVFPGVGQSRSSAWTDYIRSLDRYFGIGSFGSWRAAVKERAQGNEFHTYFAVVEKGTLTGRLHIHVIHCFKDLPRDFSDPNYGAVVASKREISAMKRFWNYGFSAPMAVRFSAQDSFGRLGWRWPVVIKAGVVTSLPSKQFGAIVGYIGKYISKDINEKGPGCIWRTRVSRNLGRERLKSMVSQLPLKSRVQLLRSPVLKLFLGQTQVPKVLLRRLLMLSLPRHSLRRIYILALKRPVLSIFGRFRALIQGTLVFNSPSFGAMKVMTSRMQAVFECFSPGTFTYACAGAGYAL